MPPPVGASWRLKYGDGAWPYYEDEITGEIWEENGGEGGYDEYNQYGDGGDDEGQQIFVAQVEAQAYSSLGPWLQVNPADLLLTLVEDSSKNLRPSRLEYPKDLVEIHVDYKSLLFGIRPGAILPEKEPPAKSPAEKDKEKEKAVGSPTVSFKPASMSPPEAGSGTSTILASLIDASPAKGGESPMKRMAPIPLARRFSEATEGSSPQAAPAASSRAGTPSSADPAAGRKSARKEARVAVAEEKRDKRASTKRTRTAASPESEEDRTEKVAKGAKARKPAKEVKTRRSGSPLEERAHASRPARNPKDPAVTGARNALAAVTSKPGKKLAGAEDRKFQPAARNALAPRPVPVFVDPLDDDEDEPETRTAGTRNALSIDTGPIGRDTGSTGVARNALGGVGKSRVDTGLRDAARVARPRDPPAHFERERLSPEPTRGRRSERKELSPHVIELNNTPEKPLNSHRTSAASTPFGGIFGRAAAGSGLGALGGGQRETRGTERPREREREPRGDRDFHEAPAAPPPRAAPAPIPARERGDRDRPDRAGGFALRALGGGGLLGNRR